MNQITSVISVAISAAALAIVAVSLAYQSRQIKIAQDEAMRSRHRDLVIMSMNDPALQASWGGMPFPGVSAERRSQLLFANLIFSWYFSSYLLKDANDAQLRVNLKSFFQGEIGREYWSVSRLGWLELMDSAATKRKRRFSSIAESCYQSATAGTP
ncbi:DUF6082 family protein [Streptomyces sp. NPDC101151]|uniref:DUF6082 family protein n=1 Tax=Streptomyces sp. NPDC101151 TaxID=3366115 RepID=UPI003827BCA3